MGRRRFDEWENMSPRFQWILALFGVWLLVSASRSRAASSDVDALLEKYDDGAKWQRSVIITGDSQTDLSGYREPGQGPTVVKYQIAFDGSRWLLKTDQSPIGDDGRLLPGREVNAYLLSPNRESQMVGIKIDPVSSKVLGGFALQRLQNAQERQQSLESASEYGGALRAYAPGTGSLSLIDLVRASKDRDALPEKEIDGMRCIGAAAVTPYGKVQLWFAADRGFNIVQWSLQRNASDLFGNGPLSEQVFSNPSSPANAAVDQLTAVQLKQIGEFWVPMKGRLTRTIAIADGRKQTEVETFDRSSVRINPDFEREHVFSLDVPDGTSVGYIDVPGGVQYEWRGGQVVPAVSRESIRLLDRSIGEVAQGAPRSTSDASAVPMRRPDARPLMPLGEVERGNPMLGWAGIATGIAIIGGLFLFWTWKQRMISK
jgi:hypothetical protein